MSSVLDLIFAVIFAFVLLFAVSFQGKALTSKNIALDN